MKGESSSWSNVTCGFFPAIYLITVWGWQDTKIINCLWFVTSIGRFAATWISIGWVCQEMPRIFLEICKFSWVFKKLFDTIRTLQLDQQGDQGNILCQNWEPPGWNRGLCRSDIVIITASGLPRLHCKLYSFPSDLWPRWLNAYIQLTVIRELKQRCVWAVHINWKCGIFPFKMR